jgi:phospholipid/cholesterol/gamma-HCH transport system substrate-binding protein
VTLNTSRWTALGLALFAALSAAAFIYLSGRTGGPGFGGASPYKLRVTFADAGGISKRSDVLVHGVPVGLVGGVHTHGGVTTLTLDLRSKRLPLHPDASAQIGQKTPLGESFVDLDPGRAAGSPPAPGGTIPGRPSVEIDEALKLLDPAGLQSLRDVSATLARGAASPQASAQVRAATQGLSAAVDGADRLAQALRGQEGQISRAVGNSRTLLDGLGAHDASLRSLVRDARATLAATAAEHEPLRTSLAALPGLLRRTQVTLADARPLIGEAKPEADELGSAAPSLSAALNELPPTMRAARSAIAGAPSLESAAQPALASARRVLPVAAPAIEQLGPALADIVPMARYLAPRANTVAAWFASTADLGSHGDAKGKWARFFVLLDPATATGGGPAPRGNSYTRPDDAAHNAAYAANSYPRLLPFGPALSGGGSSSNEGP